MFVSSHTNLYEEISHWHQLHLDWLVFIHTECMQVGKMEVHKYIKYSGGRLL